ncbi:ComEC/Rec2 family competence protein [Myxococcus qinghaiensis]|uniref:ComEC/Rec2 family competence protein n=1 Tax=Myxococcus qinghaiensis TaxID=2906758 RepID=UPI0020A6EA24|nr:ComEC/Rec2 family competence protein [Myxococcus qinghaiensis]MCP3162732.1 MBL fold metallo-hydrolase [Myxococcus qinghaiensis]
MSRLRLSSFLALLLAALPGIAASPPSSLTFSTDTKPLTVHFFDVGQGDAALIISPSGKTVLIDGGPPEARERLAARLRTLVTGPLDLAILTHPHLDHLGGLTAALRAVGAKRFMDPGFNHPSEAYKDLLGFVGDSVGQVMNPEPNPATPDSLLTIGLGEGVSLTVLWPRAPREPFLTGTRSDANSNSIVAKLTYGKTSFLLVGDAEPDTEAALLQRPLDLTATVLKVAHHGGRHSSTAAFLAAAKPQAAVISVGAKNDYGHPARETLERLDAVGAHVLRTDRDGEVIAASDGHSVTLRGNGGTGTLLVVPGNLKPGPIALGPVVPNPSRTQRGTVASVEPRNEDRDTSPDPTPPGERGTAASAGSSGPYVGLKNSKVFHRETCSTLKRSKSERTLYLNREAALRERRPAEDCHP